MTRFKNSVSWLLRKISLLHVADYLRYFYFKCKNYKRNQVFKNNYPDIDFPPDYLMYESFKLDYNSYYLGGKKTTAWIQELTREWLPNENCFLLDWGCGPGRVIRHWADKRYICYGSDVNKESLQWCRQHLSDIHFLNQHINPPLAVGKHTFDLIYGISILTHLSESAHFKWVEEFKRILKPSGILFLTTQGNSFKNKLTSEEKNEFDKGKLIIRDSVREGHRTFSSFHPKSFMEKLFHSFEILKFISNENEANVQDVWIIRKFNN
ncbi:MAG: Ubiquinone/menaquinone biosynthesis C-methyltransferase UbiE [Bacteroidota bacterium]|jgi:2-polyprenyl-3-methyl-5-hydroxy-6-metoxy-1,4-benzoquinol methylase